MALFEQCYRWMIQLITLTAVEEGSKIKLKKNKVFLPVLASVDSYYFLGKVNEWKNWKCTESLVVTSKKTDATLIVVFIFFSIWKL